MVDSSPTDLDRQIPNVSVLKAVRTRTLLRETDFLRGFQAVDLPSPDHVPHSEIRMVDPDVSSLH